MGADSPEDVLRKLEEFEAGFIDSGLGDKRMRSYVRGWKTEYAAVNGLSPELVKRAADPEMLKRDAMLAALRDPFAHSDEEVFRALCVLGGGKTADSPVITLDPERGMRLFSDTWRGAARSYRRDKGLFELCFGGLMSRPWNPLSNAVYYQRSRPKDADYILSDCRLLICRGGVWRQAAFESSLFDRSLLQGFLHETDARLRRYLKTGRYLRERPADSWVTEFVDAVIGADKIIMLEKSRPKINIDLSGLDKIRRDAAVTRDSLLTEEELEEPDTAPEPEPLVADLPLDGVQIRILRALLRGEDVSDILGENHLMPSVTADSINEGLFDEFGDNVIICEDDRLSLVEDYIEDIEQMLGGKENG